MFSNDPNQHAVSGQSSNVLEGAGSVDRVRAQTPGERSWQSLNLLQGTAEECWFTIQQPIREKRL